MQTKGNSCKSVIEKQKHFPRLQLITEVNLCALDVLHIHVKNGECLLK